MPTSHTIRREYMKDKKVIPYVFISPSILILLVLSYLPTPYAFILSLSKAELGTGKMTFTGLDNFITLLQDKNFWESLTNTVKYTIAATASLIIMGLILALIFNKGVKFSGVYLTILFIPWVVSEVITGATWKWLFNADFGLLNYIFKPFGLKPSIMLIKPNLALIPIILVTLWKNLSYTTLLLLAGLQNISREYLEAARIDGCSSFQTFRYITLAILKPTMVVLALLMVINCMNQTGVILVLTNGGPLRATETLSLFMYKEAFLNYHLTNAASIAVILALINIIIVAVYFRVARSNT